MRVLGHVVHSATCHTWRPFLFANQVQYEHGVELLLADCAYIGQGQTLPNTHTHARNESTATRPKVRTVSASILYTTMFTKLAPVLLGQLEATSSPSFLSPLLHFPCPRARPPACTMSLSVCNHNPYRYAIQARLDSCDAQGANCDQKIMTVNPEQRTDFDGATAADSVGLRVEEEYGYGIFSNDFVSLSGLSLVLW